MIKNQGYELKKDTIFIYKDLTELDYVTLYAEQLKKNNKLFNNQKMLINSQISGSSSLFKQMFKKKEFKKEARKYLRSVGLIE